MTVKKLQSKEHSLDLSDLNKRELTEKGTRTGLSSISNDDFKTRVLDNSSLHMLSQDGKNYLDIPHLVCLVGPKEFVGRYWIIEEGKSAYIGRHRSCEINVKENSISKKHLLLSIKDSQVFVEDKGSTNGTYINDHKVSPNNQSRLIDNSALKVGNTVFKFLDKGNYEIFSVRENLEKVFTDPLTGAGNRVMLERKAKEAFRNSQTNSEPLSCVVLDIDHFKKVNDTYGHVTGDFILKEVVQIIRKCFRAEDTFVRSGGEEFCLIMQSPIERAQKAIEEGRERIEKHAFTYKKQNLKITISAGVASYKESDKKWKEIYERADKLLYKAKATGRNKVVVEIE